MKQEWRGLWQNVSLVGNDGSQEGDTGTSSSSDVDREIEERFLNELENNQVLEELRSRNQGDYHDVPESIEAYELETNLPISIKWEGRKETVECGMTGNTWSVKVKKGGKSGRIRTGFTKQEVIEVAVLYMRNQGEEEKEAEEGEEETLDISEIDEGSLEDIEEDELLDEIPQIETVREALEG
ncbi:MAG: hypothetical protein SXQ77_13245 [Halobacteria archaeon]|nr:hypothetical protein [Halobacteria archaeon]